MADERDIRTEPDGLGDLPIQPTGSGVQDLEIAYEQMTLADAEAGSDDAVDPADDIVVGADAVPTVDGDDAADSAAHPS